MTKVSVDEFTRQRSGTPDWQRSLMIMSFTVVSVVAIAILYVAQSIFIPVALGGFLTFLLSPLVSALRQRGMARTPAVFVTVFVAALGLGIVGWVVTTQISSLLSELPKYSENIKAKAKSLRQIAERSNGLTKMFADISQELVSEPTSAGAKETEATEEAASPTDRRERVVIEPESSIWLGRVSAFLAPLMEYLAELALALVLVVFMLQKREELRNRLIRLVGGQQIVAATRFVDEAGHRISRFLLRQAMVNATFGFIIGLGLLLMGVKYALLWGFLAAMLRYLPYIGPYLAAVFPILLSVAMFDGWKITLMVAGLYVVLELIIANAVEPWLYGQSMGVSEIALLVSAAFWAFLWGPVGLVLSSPLTVCLVTLGRYIPRLEFLSIILGDEPALDASVSFYQRLLARDQDEAEDLIQDHLKDTSEESVYDEMLIPALLAAKVSCGRGDITEADKCYVSQAIHEIGEDLEFRRESTAITTKEAHAVESEAHDKPAPAVLIFGYPAQDAMDRDALEMLGNLLDPVHWNLEVIAPETLTAEFLDRVAEERPSLVCIMATPPGGLVHARCMSKRLRSRFPNLKILVCRWNDAARTRKNPGQLLEAGADFVTSTLLETRQQLAVSRPVLAQIESNRAHRMNDEAIRSERSNRSNVFRHASDRDVVTGTVTS